MTMQAQGTEKRVGDPAQPARHACRVLLVDPDRPVREALGEAFRMHGFEVWAISDVSELNGAGTFSVFDAGLVDVGRGRSGEWRVVEILRRGGVRHLAAMSVRAGVAKGRESSGVEAVWEKPLVLDDVLCWLERVRGEPVRPWTV